MNMTQKRDAVLQVFGLKPDSTPAQFIAATTKPTASQTAQLGLLATVGINWEQEIDKLADKLNKQAEPTVHEFNLSASGKAIAISSNKSQRRVWLPLEVFKMLVELKEYPQTIGQLS